MPLDTPLAITLAYHESTKHLPGRYARSLGYMDWDTQPDPFRRYHGAPLLPLDLVPPTDEPRYEPAFIPGNVAAAPLDRKAISQLLFDSMALSAWKEAGTARWSLRVNPSSGNLHPTESYLVCGAIPGLTESPAIFHYAPREHSLELRLSLPEALWSALASQLPANAILIGLSSIYWRESWKYGERAFRYCQHDVGHAIGALSIAAAGLGWEARLLERVLDPDLAVLLGIHKQFGIESEHPDLLMAIYPHAPDRPAFSVEEQRAFDLPAEVIDALRKCQFQGAPNVLSTGHHEWPEIDDVGAATEKRDPPREDYWQAAAKNSDRPDNESLTIGDSPLSLRRILRQRRSAVALDGHTGIDRSAFYQILLKAVPGERQIPFSTLPSSPRVDLLLFVHRVADLQSGLYVLARDPARIPTLRDSLDPGFVWTVPEACPPSLPLFLLEAGDARPAAVQTSCGQEIAGAGVFAAAMLAEYRDPISQYGAWLYRRLHWEAGLLGQLLYLEAEASGIRGTGIGCFFDDLTHRIFGVRDDRHRVIYHFTMGGPVDDSRLQTTPAYPDRF